MRQYARASAALGSVRVGAARRPITQTDRTDRHTGDEEDLRPSRLISERRNPNRLPMGIPGAFFGG